MMDVVVTTGAISRAKLQSNPAPTNQHPVFLQTGSVLDFFLFIWSRQ